MHPDLLKLFAYVAVICFVSLPLYYVLSGRFSEWLGVERPVRAVAVSVASAVCLLIFAWSVLTGRLLVLMIEVGSRLP